METDSIIPDVVIQIHHFDMLHTINTFITMRGPVGRI